MRKNIRRKVIVLWGKKEVGKTETINNVYVLLKREFKDRLIENRDHTIRGRDIRFVFNIRGTKIKIGIESCGDPGNKRLKESLELFVRLECTIIICAARISRSRTKIFKVADDLRKKHGYKEVLWLKMEEDVMRKRERRNKAMAKKIIEEIKKVIR